MSYVNVGAYVNGRRPASKKAVREAIKTDPASVRFDTTSMFDGEPRGLAVTDLRPGLTYSLVGPDPYRDRRFYGTVTVGRNGVVTVK